MIMLVLNFFINGVLPIKTNINNGNKNITIRYNIITEINLFIIKSPKYVFP